MTVAKNKPEASGSQEASTPSSISFDPKSIPGFHVMRGDEHLGTFIDEEQAEAFISGHAGEDCKVVEGSEAEASNEA